MSEEVKPTDEWGSLYWAYNCPLQMWQRSKDTWRVLNYMPRKEDCDTMDEPVTREEMPQFCRNAAIRLRNLAKLFDAMAEGKIDYIYYPDKDVEKAIAECEADRAKGEEFA